MRTVLILSTLAAILATAGTAAAQPASRPALSPLNCDALNKSTMICVRNTTQHTINRISCSGFFGTTDLSIAQGIIAPGSTTIVDFAVGKCSKQIDVVTRDGKRFQFLGFDPNSNTSLVIDSAD